MELKMPHKKLFFPYYKASSNVFLSAKGTLLNYWSMNLSNVSNITSTCTKATKTVDKIVPENTSFLKDKFNLELTNTNEKLSNIC